MDLLKRELFDIYVYGTAQPHFDGRCADTNKYFSKNEEAVADKELRTFAQQIIEMCDSLTLDSRNFSERKIVKERLRQMLQIVCDELGEESQLAMDIKDEIEKQDAELHPRTYFHDSIQRIRRVFALGLEHDTEQDCDS